VKLGTSLLKSSVTEKKGIKRGLEGLVPDVLQEYLHQFRVPDWALLYFKLEAKIPDKGWQTMTNLAKLVRTRVSHLKLLLCLWTFIMVALHRGEGASLLYQRWAHLSLSLIMLYTTV